jgi:hypothetical protein
LSEVWRRAPGLRPCADGAFLAAIATAVRTSPSVVASIEIFLCPEDTLVLGTQKKNGSLTFGSGPAFDCKRQNTPTLRAG